MSEYYYLDLNNQQQGPVTPTLFPRLGVTPSTLVWKVGMDKWIPAGEIPELREFLIPPAQSSANYQGSNFNTFQGMQPQLPPPTNLVWAILTTVLCCLPFGIVAIVYASQVESEWNMGHYERAWRKSNLARTWSIVSAAVGILAGIFAFFTGFLANLGSF